jgi:prevent-host-death family protein
MKEIGSYEAKTHLPHLLESVLGGESFIITRRGQPIALLVPIAQDELTPAQAVQQIRELRKGASWGGEGSTREAMDEGRR